MMSVIALLVVVVFALDLILLVGLIALKPIHRARVSSHDRRRSEYIATLSRHLAFEHSVDPIPPDVAEDEAFLDAVIDLRNTVTGPEIEKLSVIANKFDLVARQSQRLTRRFPLSRRLRAAVSLAEMGDESSAALLIEHLDDPEDEIRVQAARGLARMGHTPAIDHILYRLERETPWVRARFSDSLIGFGNRAAQPVMAYVRVNHREGDPQAVSMAINALAVIGDHTVGPQLAEVLDLASDVEIKIAAVGALGSVGGAFAIPAVSDAFNSSDWRVRARAATSLGGIGDPSVIAQLSAALEDKVWWVRRNSAAALAVIPGGVTALYRGLTSVDPFARDAAAEALEDVGQLAQARENHDAGVATNDELRLLRHMRGAQVVPA